MRRKRRIDTRQVYKWKARLNVHQGQQEHGVNFWETYVPVVSWQTLRLFFIHSILKGWHSKQMDFVLAYPHAPAEVPLYMHFPKGYKFKDGISEDTHVLKLTKNIYGIICNPTNDKSYECWVDADFAGGFDRKIAGTDPTTSKSCSGWAITYAGCPVTWASKLRTLTALSTTEAEYIALSTAC